MTDPEHVKLARRWLDNSNDCLTADCDALARAVLAQHDELQRLKTAPDSLLAQHAHAVLAERDAALARLSRIENGFVCIECGLAAVDDEDGCCVTCGRDCLGFENGKLVHKEPVVDAYDRGIDLVLEKLRLIAKRTDEHEFAGDGCDCTECGEGRMHYLHRRAEDAV